MPYSTIAMENGNEPSFASQQLQFWDGTADGIRPKKTGPEFEMTKDANENEIEIENEIDIVRTQPQRMRFRQQDVCGRPGSQPRVASEGLRWPWGLLGLLLLLLLLLQGFLATAAATDQRILYHSRRGPADGQSHYHYHRGLSQESSLLRTELFPTSSLAVAGHERGRKLGRNRGAGATDKHLHEHEHDADYTEWPEEWFHPYSRAVYATLHPPFPEDGTETETPISSQQQQRQPSQTSPSGSRKSQRDLLRKQQQQEQQRAHYRDFVAHRHLSRFERAYREKLGLNLHPNWAGNYSDPTDCSIELHHQRRHGFRRRGQNATGENHHRISDSRRGLLESLVGGVFDDYQGVPLSQGYGTHYVHLWVGSPIPQRQTVIVDTGSHYTGFPVANECKHCGEEHHTDPHFDPSRSDTFRMLECPGECVETFGCEEVPPKAVATSTNGTTHRRGPPAARCTFTQAYTEGSSWTAYQARDVVYCGSGADLLEAVDPLDTRYAIPFVFGCLKANTGLFKTQLADGIMGMSAHELTLPKQLYNERKIEHNMFALCFRKELGTSKRGVTAGSMILGGASSVLDTSPMVYAQNIRPYGWYTVYLEKVYVATRGGHTFVFDDPSVSHSDLQKEFGIVPIRSFHPVLVNRERGVIVDSGTTDTYIPSSIREEFCRIWKDATGTEYSNGAIYLTQSQLKKLPTLLLQFRNSPTTPQSSAEQNGSSTKKSENGGQMSPRPVQGQVGYLDPDNKKDVLLAVPATSYMEYSPTLKVYTSRLFFTETKGGVIGANSMQGHNILFDWQHGRIGFAQSSCAYDLLAGKNDNHADFGSAGSGGDCQFFDHGRSPVLTQTCLESILGSEESIAVCEASDNPTNVEISGTEVWTLQVEFPGSDPDSCENAMREWSESQDTTNQVDPSTTACIPGGLCQEFRPCHVPCTRAIAYRAQQAKLRGKRHGRVHQTPSKGSLAAPGSKDGTTHEAVTVPHSVVNRTSDPAEAAALCSDWRWSACDHSCRQSRLSVDGAVAHANGIYCLESERETRRCHVGVCGRSDPCLVPFLVHAILVLEARPPRDGAAWTPWIEEEFRRRLTFAAHDPGVRGSGERGMLFGAGDVNVLAVRPYYGDDEDDDEEEETDEDGGTERRSPLGTQLILQISISNPKATRKDQNPEHGGRKLLQEVGVVWSNITSAFRRSKATSLCDPFDLYPLAKNANLVADKILPSPRFLALLVSDDDNGGDEEEDGSPREVPRAFGSSRLVSSWTIGTQIYDDSVNYLGPLASNPFFTFLKLAHEAFVLIIAFWCLVCLAKSSRLVKVCIVRGFKKWNPDSYQNDPVSRDDDNNIIIHGDAGAGGEGSGETTFLLSFLSSAAGRDGKNSSGGIELTTTTTSHLGSRVKKRITR